MKSKQRVFLSVYFVDIKALYTAFIGHLPVYIEVDSLIGIHRTIHAVQNCARITNIPAYDFIVLSDTMKALVNKHVTV